MKTPANYTMQRTTFLQFRLFYVKYMFDLSSDCLTPSTPKPSPAPVSSLVFIVSAGVLSFTLLVAVVITIGVWINQK